MIFIIIASIIMVVNIVFLIGSLIYTVMTKSKVPVSLGPRTSIAPSMMSCQGNPRLSIQPQVTIYQVMVRLSTGSAPLDMHHHHHLATKPHEEPIKEIEGKALN